MGRFIILWTMIVHKIIKRQTLINPMCAKLPIDLMGNFKIILVHKTGVHSLIGLIICHRIKRIRVDPIPVIPMHDLSQQPKIRLFCF